MSLKYGERNITDIFVGDKRIIKRIQNGNVLYEKSSKPVFDDRFCFYNPGDTPATVQLLTYAEVTAYEEATDTAHIKIDKSIDNGSTWSTWCDIGGGVDSPVLTIDPGKVVYMRGENPYFSTSKQFGPGDGYVLQAGKHFKITGTLECHGDLMNLMKDKNNIPRAGFYKLFSGCKGLLTAPNISGTGVVEHLGCYYMFYNCTNMITGPKELNFTKVSSFYEEGRYSEYEYNGGYYYMFYNCSSLVESPILGDFVKATRYEGEYRSMFFNCHALNKVTVMWNNIPRSLSGWLYKVAPTGTFIKPKTLQLPLDSDSGIPTGWTIQDI